MASRNVLFPACLFALLGADLMAAPQPQHPAASKPVAVAKTPMMQDTRPDLVVVSINFTSFTTSRDSNGVLRGGVIPAFTYKNQGRSRSGPFQVAWEYWDTASKTWQPHLGQSFTNDLAPGQSWTEGGQPADSFIWTIGTEWPKFRVRLDWGHAVNESNESNNDLVREFKPRMMPLPTPTSRPLPQATIPLSF